MKSTDMELQAIREKLQLLQAEPPAAETLVLPWSEAGGTASVPQPFRSAVPAANQSPQQKLDHQNPNKSPQEIAIEALKQRSRGGDQAANARIDNLVAQELYRLEVQANYINERSQQQAADIMALKRSAQQASVGLRRQGIHTHPQLTAITQFLESYESAAVPRMEKDDQGHFNLTYDTVDFSIEPSKMRSITAHTLRNRWQTAQPVPVVRCPFLSQLRQGTLLPLAKVALAALTKSQKTG